jgi:hypothetical protein
MTQDEVSSRLSAIESSLAILLENFSGMRMTSPVNVSSSASNPPTTAQPAADAHPVDPFIEQDVQTARVPALAPRVPAPYAGPQGSASTSSASTGYSQLVTTSGSKIRHRIEDFPVYDGSKEIGRDIHFWISVIESKTRSFVDRFNDDDFRRIILGRLIGTAKDQLESTSFLFDRCRDWSEMKIYLIQSFEDPNYGLKLEQTFANRILLPVESSAAFINIWQYLARAVMEKRHPNDRGAKARFINDEVSRLISSLPVSIQSDVDSRFQRNLAPSGPVTRLTQVLLSAEIENIRFRRSWSEWSEFKSSPAFNMFADRVRENLGWLNDRLRANGHRDVSLSPAPTVTRQANISRDNRRLVAAVSGNNRSWRCVCGGSHRYADCPHESGQAKFRELQARTRGTERGVRFLAEDGGIYIVETASDQEIDGDGPDNGDLLIGTVSVQQSHEVGIEGEDPLPHDSDPFNLICRLASPNYNQRQSSDVETIEIIPFEPGSRQMNRLHPGNHSRPMVVSATVNDHSITVTVDTGSFLSIISESVLARIPNVPPMRYDDPLLERRLRGIHSAVTPKGIITLRVVLPTRLPKKKAAVNIDFVVVDNSNEVVLLGMDYLRLLGAEIDTLTRSLYFHKGGKISVPLDNHYPATVHSEEKVENTVDTLSRTHGLVVTAEARTIRPNHGAIIRVAASKCATPVGYLPANAYRQFSSFPIGLVSASLIEPAAPYCFVGVINPTTDSITIPENFPLGMLEPLSEPLISNITVNTVVPEEFIRICDEEILPSLGHLEPKQKEAVRDLCLKNHKLFHFGQKDFGRSNVAECTFRMVDGVSPINIPPRRVSPADQKDMKAELDRFQKQGLIEPSTSPWAAPAMVVRRDGKVRIVVDYRALNQAVISDQYPIPRADDIFNSLDGKQWFSSLDVMKSFFQVPINDEKCREITSFRTPFGLYRWKVMPQGFKNSPAIFQRMVDNILGSTKWEFALAYIDDLIIFSTTFDDHIEHVDRVMRLLIDAGLSIQAEKTKLFRRSIEFVGYQVSGSGRTLTEAKVEAIRQINTPENATEAVHFVALCSYYRHLIENFATIAAPLDRFRKEEYRNRKNKRDGKLGVKQTPKVFDWSPADQVAFDSLKSALMSRPVVVSFRADGQHRLLTDASTVGIGGILEQMELDGNWHPVIYLSRKLSDAERNYGATEIELLALVYCLEKLEFFLLGKPFEVVTDHIALLWLKQLKSTNRRLVRWSMNLAPFYQFMTIKHQPGTLMDNVDALSRLHRPDSANGAHFLAALTRGAKRKLQENEEQAAKRQKQPDDNGFASQTAKSSSTTVNESDSNAPNIASEQSPDESFEEKQYSDFVASLPELYESDDFFGPIRKDLLEARPAGESPRQHPQFSISDGLLWHQDTSNDRSFRLCVPSLAVDFKRWILYQAHDRPFSGHLGEEKTREKIQRAYFWRGLKRDTQQYCQECSICQQMRYNTTSDRPPLGLIPVPSERMRQISLDFIVGLPVTKNGNSGILVIVDYLSKYALFEPVPDTLTAEGFGSLFHRAFFGKYGMPATIISDNDRLFTSRFWKQLASACGVKHVFATRHHPETNGQTERLNRTLKQMIRSFADYTQKNWEEMLPNLQIAYNDSVHSATGKTPFETLHGMHPRLPSRPDNSIQLRGTAKDFADKIADTVQQVKDALLVNKYATARQYESRYAIVDDKPYREGDKVWIKTSHFLPENRRQQLSKKLLPEYIGPYPIRRVLNYYAVEVDFPPSVKINNRINRTHLKRFRQPTWRKTPIAPAPVDINGEWEYEVEEILDDRLHRGKQQYLVRWSGNGSIPDSWEPAEYLSNSRQAVKAYQSQLRTDS